MKMMMTIQTSFYVHYPVFAFFRLRSNINTQVCKGARNKTTAEPLQMLHAQEIIIIIHETEVLSKP